MTRKLSIDQLAMLRAVDRATRRAEMYGWMSALYRGDYTGGPSRTLRTLVERGLAKAVGDGDHFTVTESGRAVCAANPPVPESDA